MYRIVILLTLASLTCLSAYAKNTDGSIVLRTKLALDGRGNTLQQRDIVVRDGHIVAFLPAGQGEGQHYYDLTAFTVLPGLIDTHVHLGWHFGDDGRLAQSEQPERILHAAANGLKMLQAGVTTVQSLGGPEDGPVAKAFAHGILDGPRVITSLGFISQDTGDVAAIRETVQQQAGNGATVIKIFASESIRTGGAPSLTQQQLDAACGEAKAQGLRAVVHAHGPESAKRASNAGCNTIEHGALLDRPTFEIMAQNGTFYDPNIHLIFQNYFDNKASYLGIGNYTEEGFTGLHNAVPRALQAFQLALKIPGLKTVYGTDAVAGAHGRNAEELIYRVRKGGQAAMDALVSANSLAAESLGMADQIGSLAPAYIADIIAVEGNPVEAIEAINKVKFVMVNGRVVIQP